MIYYAILCKDTFDSKYWCSNIRSNLKTIYSLYKERESYDLFSFRRKVVCFTSCFKAKFSSSYHTLYSGRDWDYLALEIKNMVNNNSQDYIEIYE